MVPTIARREPERNLSLISLAVSEPGGSFDYHGALIVIETELEEVVFIHPPGAPAEAPASLPSNPCEPGEEPTVAAVRMAREMTGFEVEVIEELVTFIQPGTPTGTMCAHGYLGRPTGGLMLEEGPEGPVKSYPLGALPQIVPIRLANQRVLAAYLEHKRQTPTLPS
jgi:ADP-ribose pyrophosphatase YjhB (NUDIX family)